MATDTKALRTRIGSVDSTLHLTKAMGLVASSKVRPAMLSMQRSGQYVQALEKAVALLATDPLCRRCSYWQEQEGPTIMILIAGDRGMAGGFNNLLFKEAANHPDVQWIPIGKKASDRYHTEPISSERYSYEQAKELAIKLCDEYQKGEIGKVEILSTGYISMLSREVKVTKLLPFPAIDSSEKVGGLLFEPSATEILSSLTVDFVAAKIYATVRESFAAEVTARRAAMDSAGKNAQEMIDSLQLAYNRARQAAITQEITEIVAGSGS
jgi:F-type H+-transporting ATPase subunit gamma